MTPLLQQLRVIDFMERANCFLRQLTRGAATSLIQAIQLAATHVARCDLIQDTGEVIGYIFEGWSNITKVAHSPIGSISIRAGRATSR